MMIRPSSDLDTTTIKIRNIKAVLFPSLFPLLFNKMKYTNILYCSILLLSTTVSITSADEQQMAFGQPEIQIQNELNVLVDDLVQVESIATSCSSCISLLHIIKKMSYMPESFLISTLTKVCKRTQKVDDEVVCITIFFSPYFC